MNPLSLLKFKIKLIRVKIFVHFFLLKKRFNKQNISQKSKNLNLHCFVINIIERNDRWDNVIKNFKLFKNVIFYKFHISKSQDGAIGCATSHLSIISKAIDMKLDYVMIWEDDIHFIHNIEDLIIDFINSPYDIFLMSNNKCYRRHLSTNFDRVYNCQTAAAYIIKSNVFFDYYENLSKSIFLQYNKIPKKYSMNDQYWKFLQFKYTFVMYKNDIAFQVESFSDILNKVVNYNE